MGSFYKSTAEIRLFGKVLYITHMNEEDDKEKELQEWLDQVYFGSCCSDHLPDDEGKVNDSGKDSESAEKEENLQ